jgi:hypothetical protein
MYTSVPNPSIEISLRSPPKYRAYWGKKRKTFVSNQQQKRGNGAHQSRQGQSIPEPSHGRLEIAIMKILIDPLPFHRRIHVRPNQRNSAPRNPTALVRYLDGDVFLAGDDDDLDRWEEVLVVDVETFDDGAEGVFEQFETDVGEVAWDVWEGEVFGAEELDGGAFEHGVVFFADETGVFDGFLDDVVDVLGWVLGGG